MIKTLAIGHLGRDAIVNNVNGKTVINFNVAHSHSYTDGQGQKIESTVWINCAYWIEKTGIAQYLKKGQQVFVEGVPSLDTYKNDSGIVTAQLKLRVTQVQLLGSAKPGTTQNQPQQPTPPPQSINDVADDLPF